VNSSGGVTTTTSFNFGKPISPSIEKSSSSSKYNFGPSTLKEGSTGESVKELQRFLNAELGLGLGVDGKLGPKTIIVVKQWQSEHGLVSDGLVGSKTKALMTSSGQ
jgi:peptidoglycan hydrolase-like protein with peptidoglycan-binding domain